MSTGVQNKTVIVTGAGRGLGREHALLLARLGAKVIVNDVVSEREDDGESHSPAAEVVEEIRRSGGIALAAEASITDPTSAEAIVDACVSEFGTVDGVVHNAGILRDRTVQRMTTQEFDDVVDVHLRGGFNVIAPAFRVMREQGFGRIVITTSATGLLGNYGQANYGAAKMGLVGLMNVLALEGERHGILVNAVSPSAATRMTEDVLGRLAEKLAPELVSPLVAYLCSEECSVTKEIFTAGGGRFGRVFVGVTPGWYAGAEPVSLERLAEHLDEIRDLDTFHIMRDGGEEARLLKTMVQPSSVSTP